MHFPPYWRLALHTPNHVFIVAILLMNISETALHTCPPFKTEYKKHNLIFVVWLGVIVMTIKYWVALSWNRGTSWDPGSLNGAIWLHFAGPKVPLGCTMASSFHRILQCSHCAQSPFVHYLFKFGSFLDQETTLVEHTTRPTRNADGFPVDSVSKGLNLSWLPCYYLKVIDLSMMFVKTDQVCCHLHDCFAEVVL